MKIVVSSLESVHFYGSPVPGIRCPRGTKSPMKKRPGSTIFHTRNLRAGNGQLQATIWQIMYFRR